MNLSWCDLLRHLSDYTPTTILSFDQGVFYFENVKKSRVLLVFRLVNQEPPSLPVNPPDHHATFLRPTDAVSVEARKPAQHYLTPIKLRA